MLLVQADERMNTGGSDNYSFSDESCSVSFPLGKRTVVGTGW